MRRSLYNLAHAVISVNAATISSNTTTTGTGVDLHANLDHAQSALVLVQSGTLTDGSYAVTLEESADNSTFNTVAAPDLQGTAPTYASTDDNKMTVLGYVGSKRYLRVKIVSTSVTSGGVMSAVIVRGFPRRQPITHTP